MPIFGALVANWKAILGGLLLTALALQTWRIGELNDDVTAAKAETALWKQAGILAVTRAKQHKAEVEGLQDKVTTHANDDYSRRVAAFDGGVRKAAANPGSTAAPNLPRLSYNPDVFAGPDPNTVIPKDDARICGVNTLRLIVAREWAMQQSQIDRSGE